MISISEEEENDIDNIGSNIITIERGDRVFNITNNNIFCYGEVNFLDKEDLNKIDSFSFLNYLDSCGIKVCSNYDYETHSCISPKEYYLFTETWSPSFLAKFAHASLNKPKRILLFNQTIK